jgi:hypothetical protein
MFKTERPEQKAERLRFKDFRVHELNFHEVLATKQTSPTSKKSRIRLPQSDESLSKSQLDP